MLLIAHTAAWWSMYTTASLSQTHSCGDLDPHGDWRKGEMGRRVLLFGLSDGLIHLCSKTIIKERGNSSLLCHRGTQKPETIVPEISSKRGGESGMVRGYPCNHPGPLVGGTPKPLPPNPPLTLYPLPLNALFVPQSSCLTNWCFFFAALWSWPCCADGKLSGKCYFYPWLNWLFSFDLFFHFFFFLVGFYFPPFLVLIWLSSSEHQCLIGLNCLYLSLY